MNMEELKEQYEIDITLSEETIDKQIISLPKLMSKYQNKYHEILNSIAINQDILDKKYYESYLSYKQGNHELANFSLGSTELKKLLETDIVYRETKLAIAKAESDLKLIEEMLSTIKSIGYSVNNYLTYKRIMIGDI